MLHVKRPYQPAEQMRLEHANRLLLSSELSGDELAWQPGMAEWGPLSTIPGVISTTPPPLPPEIPPPIRRQITAYVPPIADHLHATHTTPPTELDQRYKGVGGWLLFFCVGLTILGPLFSLGQMAYTWKQSQTAFAIYPTIESAILCENIGSSVILIYGFIVGCTIWRGNHQGRDIARLFLLFRLSVFVSVELIAVLIIGDLPKQVFAIVAGGVFVPIGREIAYFAIWWSYFTKSKRVRNTYNHDHNT